MNELNHFFIELRLRKKTVICVVEGKFPTNETITETMLLNFLKETLANS